MHQRGTVDNRYMHTLQPSSINAALEQVRFLSEAVRPVEAEDSFKRLVDSLSGPDLVQFEHRLVEVIEAEFLRARRKRLLSYLEAKLGSNPPALAERLTVLREEVRANLADLSNYHLWRWSTNYPSALELLIDRAHLALREGIRRHDVGLVLTEEFSRHSLEIFSSKGYNYQTRTERRNHSEAITKGLSGLFRFVGLVIQSYSQRVQTIQTQGAALDLRAVTSGILAGILHGFGRGDFGDVTGGQLLPTPDFIQAWAHFLPFLKHQDLVGLLQALEPVPFVEGLRVSVSPTLCALDQILEDATVAHLVIPGQGQYRASENRVEMRLDLPGAAQSSPFLEVWCYLVPASKGQLEEASREGVAVVVAPLQPDLAGWIRCDDVLASMVVRADLQRESEEDERCVGHALDTLRSALGRLTKNDAGSGHFHTNYAKGFPLEDLTLLHYFRVNRGSVRQLLQTMERKNGIHLWCSVRRSGKTTACQSLDSSTSNAPVITQTCDNTSLDLNSDHFYRQVQKALAEGQPISRTFFRDLVHQCLDAPLAEDSRVIWVLDEYESLFGLMDSQAEERTILRYNVVQPLLNQMVAFSRENLLILVGQRPDAHFILPEQNQLSPCVHQDPFPLFPNAQGRGPSEFKDLVRIILTKQVNYEEEFLGALFEETAGHPYLTVKVLVDFCDWLITHEVPLFSCLKAQDFEQFQGDRLNSQALRRSVHYQLFSRAASEALSSLSRARNPWLYGIYTVLRALALEDPVNMVWPIDRVEEFIQQSDIPAGARLESLLQTGTMTNFFQMEGDFVKPRIRVLARLAGSVILTERF
jgi:hypothetical protein